MDIQECWDLVFWGLHNQREKYYSKMRIWARYRKCPKYFHLLSCISKDGTTTLSITHHKLSVHADLTHEVRFVRNKNPDGYPRLVGNSGQWYLNLAIYFLIFFSLLLFAAWLWTMLVTPAADAQRARKFVTLVDGRIISVDYPRRILISESPSQIYITANTRRPISATFELPANLPLVLASAIPSNSVQLDTSLNSEIIVSWPITMSPATHSTDATTTTLPIYVPTRTISLFISNARIERGWPIPFLHSGFTQAKIVIANGVDNSSLDVEIETTDRLTWRLFAEKYSFLAIAPLLIAVIGGLGKMRIDQQRRQLKQATTELDRLLALVSKATTASVTNRQSLVISQFKTLRLYKSLLEKEDWKRITRLVDLHSGKIIQVNESIAIEDFCEWPDAWAGALITAVYSLHDQHKAVRPRQPEEEAIVNRWLRTFPSDLLSAHAREQLLGAQRQVLHGSLPLQAFDWPLLPDPPKGFSKTNVQEFTICAMQLFPYLDAGQPEEQSFLFSRYTKWFWPDHSLVAEILNHDRNVIVEGQTGVGLTALALGVSKYAERHRRILPVYLVGPCRLDDIQLESAKELLNFVCNRPDWLGYLQQEDRDLLARLLTERLSQEFLSAKVASSVPIETALPLEDDEQEYVRIEQSKLELRLLRQSVKRVASLPPIPLNQWFLGFRHCAKRLNFRQVCIALDMKFEQWVEWQEYTLPQIVSVTNNNRNTLPLRYIATISQAQKTIPVQCAETEVRELKWSEGMLLSMLEHRILARGIPEELLQSLFPARSALTAIANVNPRCLAALWQKLERQFPNADTVSESTIDYVKGQRNDCPPF